MSIETNKTNGYSNGIGQTLNNNNTSNQFDKQQANRLSQFYAGKNILITGATGFVGKVCLVKIVRSLADSGKVYVMLRSKRGMSPQQRFDKMLKEEPFNTDGSTRANQSVSLANDSSSVTLKSEQVNKSPSNGTSNKKKNGDKLIDWSKVIAIEGDMSCKDLGLADDVKEKLCKSIDIVFNIAASVQFDAPLKQNLRDNYSGARNILQLATSFERLISFVHVSTFFTNSHISHVEEKVLPMNRDCEKMAELISWIPDSLCDSIGPQIMENRPNTYIFTKAMAENLVQKYQGQLPIAIVRPSIVTPSVKDPYPGWVDNVNGPMGLGVLASLGILRNIDWNYYGVCDFIPVDFVVNTMLAVAERTARLHPKEIKVYNCSSSSLRQITWGQGFEVLRLESLKAPPYKMLRLPINVPRHRRANKIGFQLTKLSELLFAYFIDFILMLCGQKQLLTKLTAKLHHGYKILLPFTTTEYTCSNDNLLAALDELHPNDKEEFDFDIKNLDWEKAFTDSYYGARRRILKEDISNVPAALFKMRVLTVVETTFKIIFYGLLVLGSYRSYKYFSTQPMLSF